LNKLQTVDKDRVMLNLSFGLILAVPAAAGVGIGFWIGRRSASRLRVTVGALLHNPSSYRRSGNENFADYMDRLLRMIRDYGSLSEVDPTLLEVFFDNVDKLIWNGREYKARASGHLERLVVLRSMIARQARQWGIDHPMALFPDGAFSKKVRPEYDKDWEAILDELVKKVQEITRSEPGQRAS
jgi:hypothetical protein